MQADIADRHVDIVEVPPPWDGIGEHTRFPIARLRYAKSSGQWSIYWRTATSGATSTNASGRPRTSGRCSSWFCRGPESGPPTARAGRSKLRTTYSQPTTVDRHELHELVDELPEDQVGLVLVEVRSRLPLAEEERPWPPAFFGIGESKGGRTDNSRRVDEILAEGFGAPRG